MADQPAPPDSSQEPEDPKPTAPAPGGSTKTDDGPAAPADERLRDDLRDNARYVNNQYFYGSVSAPGSSFGSSHGASGSTGGNATGPVTTQEVAGALRCYVRPAPFQKALKILAERRVVVLCGEAGIGKYAGGLALLREVGGQDGLPTNLSPALTFAELAAQKFGNPDGYLVRDHLTDSNASAVQQFELQRLLIALHGRSYLVITTDLGARPRGTLADLMVDWTAPDCGAVFDRFLRTLPAGAGDDDRTDQLRDRLSAYGSPRDVIVIGSLLAKEGPEKALAALENTWQDQITAWFDGNPPARDVLTMAALAFLDGTPEAVFEQWLARLVALHSEISPTPAAQAPPADTTAGMSQSRVWASGGLITVSLTDDPHVVGMRCVSFAGGPDMRALVVRLLHERYGYELWEPVRTWLDEIAAAPPSPTHVRLALGVALWSRCNFREVEQTFLDTWSNGLAPARLAAACTLSWIGMDGTHASAALGLVKGWAQNAGPRRAVTSASVLGGPLGLRYQSDALRWLWTLAMRQQMIRDSAGVALGLLFAAATDDTEASRRMLNFLRSRVRHALAAGESQRIRKATFETVLMVLEARSPDTDVPVATAVLSQDSRNIDRLGELWADLLCSGSLRREARTALLETLEPVSGDAAALGPVERLGQAVRSRLTAAQWAALQQGLDREALDRAESGRSADLFAAVLAALRGSTSGKPGPVRQQSGRTR